MHQYRTLWFKSSADPDQTVPKEQYDQGVQCLSLKIFWQFAGSTCKILFERNTGTVSPVLTVKLQGAKSQHGYENILFYHIVNASGLSILDLKDVLTSDYT